MRNYTDKELQTTATLIKIDGGGYGRNAPTVCVFVATEDFEYVEKYWKESRERVFHALGGVIEDEGSAKRQELAARELCKSARTSYAYKKIRSM